MRQHKCKFKRWPIAASIFQSTLRFSWAVAVSQLVDLSLPIPEVCGSNPVISKIYIEHLQLTVLIDEHKEKEAGKGRVKTPVRFFSSTASVS